MFNNKREHRTGRMTETTILEERLFWSAFISLHVAGVSFIASIIALKPTVEIGKSIQPSYQLGSATSKNNMKINPEIIFPITKLFSDPATAILSPIAININIDDKAKKIVTTHIPMNYFSVSAVDPAKTAKQEELLKNYINDQINSQNRIHVRTPFANKTLSKMVTTDNDLRVTSPVVGSLTVTSTSSPEFGGNDAISINQVDFQNVVLAQQRLQSVLKATKELKVPSNKIRTSATEAQLTAADRLVLVKYANSIKLQGNNNQKIFQIAQMVNNDNELPESIRLIFESKRGVIINLEVITKYSDKTVISIPILLYPTILLLFNSLPTMLNYTKTQLNKKSEEG